MAERYIPIGDRVLIIPVAPPTEIKGIIIPDSAQPKPVRGRIEEVGDTVENIKVGDVVLYGKYSGTDLELNGSEVVLMSESDVLAIVRTVK